MSCEIIYPVEFPEPVLANTATDFDGVMFDTRTMVTDNFNRRFGTTHTPDGLLNWHTVRDWAIEKGMDKEEAEKFEWDLWHKDEFLFSAEPLPGAVEFMREAYKRDYQIPIFSSRFFRQREVTIRCCEIHLPFVNPDNIHVSLDDLPREMNKVWMIQRKRSKPYRVFLEDSKDHARLILENTDAYVILVSNDSSLDVQYLGNRLSRIHSEKGTVPDLWPLYNAFFGPRP